MFSFFRNDKKVLCYVECKSQVKYRYLKFEYVLDSELFADLLLKHLQDTAVDVATEIRRKAYEQGWKDAKAKRRKKTNFASTLNALPAQSSGCY